MILVLLTVGGPAYGATGDIADTTGSLIQGNPATRLLQHEGDIAVNQMADPIENGTKEVLESEAIQAGLAAGKALVESRGEPPAMRKATAGAAIVEAALTSWEVGDRTFEEQDRARVAQDRARVAQMEAEARARAENEARMEEEALRMIRESSSPTIEEQVQFNQPNASTATPAPRRAVTTPNRTNGDDRGHRKGASAGDHRVMGGVTPREANVMVP